MKCLSFRSGIKISRKLYHELRPLEFALGRPKLHRIHGANTQRKKGQRRGEGLHEHRTHRKQPFVVFRRPLLIPVTLPSLMEESELASGRHALLYSDSSCARMSECPVCFVAKSLHEKKRRLTGGAKPNEALFQQSFCVVAT